LKKLKLQNRIRRSGRKKEGPESRQGKKTGKKGQHSGKEVFVHKILSLEEISGKKEKKKNGEDKVSKRQANRQTPPKALAETVP